MHGGKNAIGICARARWCLIAVLVKNSAAIWTAGDSGTSARVASPAWWRRCGASTKGTFADGRWWCLCVVSFTTLYTWKQRVRLRFIAEGLLWRRSSVWTKATAAVVTVECGPGGSRGKIITGKWIRETERMSDEKKEGDRILFIYFPSYFTMLVPMLRRPSGVHIIARYTLSA